MVIAAPESGDVESTLSVSPSASVSFASTLIATVWPLATLAVSGFAIGAWSVGGVVVPYDAAIVCGPDDTFTNFVLRPEIVSGAAIAGPPSTRTLLRLNPPNVPGNARLCASLPVGTLTVNANCRPAGSHAN